MAPAALRLPREEPLTGLIKVPLLGALQAHAPRFAALIPSQPAF